MHMGNGDVAPRILHHALDRSTQTEVLASLYSRKKLWYPLVRELHWS